MKIQILGLALLVGTFPALHADVLIDCDVEVVSLSGEKTKDGLRVKVDEGEQLTIEVVGSKFRDFLVAPGKPNRPGPGVFNGSDGTAWKIESERIETGYRVRTGITIDRRTGQFKYWNLRLDKDYKPIHRNTVTGVCGRTKNLF